MRFCYVWCTEGSGFASKSYYGSGFFHMEMKVPGRDSAGVVTTFYMSQGKAQGNDELDFEFLGNREGKPYTLQTNVIVQGHGDREQKIQLWFDPTSSFHTYKILWNPYQIVFFVDNHPIRVFQNRTNIGAQYPTQPMKVMGSIWNGEDWATDGGKEKINWTYAPFKAQYQGFDVDGCTSGNFKTQLCSSSDLWWNSAQYQSLSATEESLYEYVKKNYLTYDYCSDKSRFPIPPPECPH
ncbi:Xyloglucan endotransglucosylase/hydrolase protein 2 [Cinnamomum micranthum f. kanehirae]|uniref:Xyloglucan endotransglucosylase/hydrolase n=1 Tax=Cinnamomum micranthum f. kanehirae TaxID=337451 RepID=A0A443NQV7_9MAGN|nr:Xyloglucan endotransglucosylase/hydrolase protein 2 [Cinnamomum micranthum f. kanehirae]